QYDEKVINPNLDVNEEVAAALRGNRPVVALESTVIAHGLPWPQNQEAAHRVEAAVRSEGAIPATIAVCGGRPIIGLSTEQIQTLARTIEPTLQPRVVVRKAARRDLAAAIAQKAYAGTTVSGTLALAHLAGIRVFATGGIGGVHPGA